MARVSTAIQVRRSLLGILLTGLAWPLVVCAAEPKTAARVSFIPPAPIAAAPMTNPPNASVPNTTGPVSGVKFRQPDGAPQGIDPLVTRLPPGIDVEDPARRPEPDCKAGARSKPIYDINTDIRPTGELLPLDCSQDVFTPPNLEYIDLRRYSGITPFGWEASGICLRPTYFDDVPLERYGQTLHEAAQPFISSAHFFATVPLLPYKTTLAPPHVCRYTLGYHRPGDAAPCYYPWLPWDTRAALVEGATIAGFVLIFP